MKERCQAKVYVPGVYSSVTCSREAKRDGYCTQHHPDNVAARRAKRTAKWDAEYAAIQAAKDAKIDALRLALEQAWDQGWCAGQMMLIRPEERVGGNPHRAKPDSETPR